MRSLLLLGTLLCTPIFLSVCQINNPIADPKAVVTSGDARFTILTPQLIRMEWSENATFEDRASLVFTNRSLPVPTFQKSEDGGWIVLRTEKLTLRYKMGSGKFGQDNLEITLNLNGRTVTWHPGLQDRGNLKGTIRTLDGVKGATALEPGLLSRDGWAVIDDSER
ncbi:MAG: glycosyl hydrolase family 31, partial [Bacteroidota bacterium]